MTDKPFSQINLVFGDGEYTFALTWAGAQEWEEKTGRSLYHTFNDMVSSRMGFVSDIREIVRIALIGGGTAPSEAFRLVKRYVEGRPLAETMPVALEAIEAFLFGTEEAKEPEAANG